MTRFSSKGAQNEDQKIPDARSRRGNCGATAADAVVALAPGDGGTQAARTVTRIGISGWRYKPPRRASRDVYCYFDNDVKVHAPFDAHKLALRVLG